MPGTAVHRDCLTVATSRCPHLGSDIELDTREVDRSQVLADGDCLADFPIPEHYDDFGPYGNRLRTWRLHSESAIEALLAEILESCALEHPVDGDCLRIARAVTSALCDRGVPASTVTIAGWMDTEETLLAFLHLATGTDHVILDGTARLFDRALPAAWIAPQADYLHRLAVAAGIDHAAILSR
ncbi:hypothetical protein [Nocardia thailandica]|uniref:hypothetical protein n=1 Tax=Nocardia thailandica TaxID=257275 RepID=UPI0002DF4868|nr:hypothetical protein [Nocardia thailandica]